MINSKIFLKGFLLFLTLISVFTLTACGDDKPNDEKYMVYTSMSALHDFTSRILGDKANVVNLIPENADAHGYEPTAKQVAEMTDSAFIVVNGLNFEDWTESVSSDIKSKLVVTSKGINTLTTASGNTDPHIWLDIENAIIQMNNIKEKAIEYDQSNADYYESNFKRNELLFKSLDDAYNTTLSLVSTESKKIVVSRGCYGYLANAYGLNHTSITDISDDLEPTGSRLAEIINLINDESISTIFYDTLEAPATANIIAKETNAKISWLDNCEALELNSTTNNYLSVMAQNLLNLKEAFGV